MIPFLKHRPLLVPAILGWGLLAGCQTVTPVGSTVMASPRTGVSGYNVQAVTFGRDKLKGTTKTQGDFNLANRFSVEIDGVLIAGIRRVDGLKRILETGETRDGKGASKRYRPGRPTYGSITIGKDWSPNSQFYRWRQAVIDGKVDRKSISIIVRNDPGEEARRLNLFNCYPTRWQGPSLNAKNSAHATETIEIRYETFELK